MASKSLEGCCLAWGLTESAQALVTDEQLLSLREEVKSCAELVDATIIEDGLTSGTLLREVGSGGAQSSEDGLVRIGQLLCRWASLQEPPLGLRVGVASGQLRKLSFGGGEGPCGHALGAARGLRERSRDLCVHLSRSVRERLCMLEQLSFSLTPSGDSCFLEPWTQAEPRDERVTQRMSIQLPRPWTPLEESADMSFEAFRDLLQEHGVDLWRFGHGHAKTLQQFYRSTVLQKRSKLVVSPSGELQQFVELARISLRAPHPDGHERQLRLCSEITEDGRCVQRNLRPAVKVRDGAGWREAVGGLFQRRFGITEQAYWCLGMDSAAHSYKEESACSLSTPGIMTTYKVHEVDLRIELLDLPGLEPLGLPGLKPFSTPADSESGAPKANWAWLSLDPRSSDIDALVDLLEAHGINAAEFTQAALAELSDEVQFAKYATLSVQQRGQTQELERHISIIKVWLCADALSVEHVLVHRWELKDGKFDDAARGRPVSGRMLQAQDWQDAVRTTMLQKLGLDVEFQERHLSLDERSYRLSEEVAYSRTYPGLRTVYSIHDVRCRILDPEGPGLERLGLPEGSDCTVTRLRDDQRASVAGWCWKPLSELTSGPFRRSLFDQPLPKPKETCKRRLPPPPGPGLRPVQEPGGAEGKRQGAAAGAAGPADAPGKGADAAEADKCPSLEELLKGRQGDWKRARTAAERICDEHYTCRHFFEDCIAAFPELGMYLCGDVTSSGRLGEDEYQRTLGALFAVYWLMRSPGDGAQSFCFGVDDDWLPLSRESPWPARAEQELKKRQEAYEGLAWDRIRQLLVDAGLLRAEGGHDPERTLAMLVLTAIHDIMKVQCLVPEVDSRHCEEWCGYKPGDRIGDHDAALGYVLEHRPESLPSFTMLPRAQRESLKFTQCKMDYNMGWLVQAEAPPGALFSRFRGQMLQGKASPMDVSFYFVHWLTDLAGAEPFPQEGCEKFVLKFPLRVLGSFLDSFKVVQELANRSETEVLEDYLLWRWQERCGLPAPQGPGSIARLRVALMSQGHERQALRAYERLRPEDRKVLDDELARTGCEGQRFLRENEDAVPEGPALLVYYSPALMQKAGSEDPEGALQVLADVMRQGRALFPLDRAAAGETAIIRIDALKDLLVPVILGPDGPGNAWMLQRTSSKDAQVRRVSVVELQAADFQWHLHRPIFATWKTPGARRAAVVPRRKCSSSSPISRNHSEDSIRPPMVRRVSSS